MKIIKTIFLAASFFIISNHVHAQTDTLQIRTSAVCEQCKERIESDLSFEKGIKSSNLDLKSKIITVIYNPNKTDKQKIREAITKIGYDADSLKADSKSFNKLPDCCKHPDKPN